MPGVTRRSLLAAGATGAVLTAGAAIDLVAHGDLPGRSLLDRIDGACDAPAADERFRTPGPTVTGSFFSAARGREVDYTLAYPPGHGPGSRLPLAVCLYGDGGSYRSPIGRLPLATALAGSAGTRPLPPMAIVEPDGGADLYWNPHPHDDPLAMVADELIPRLAGAGLGGRRGNTGAIGISMGGYGALLLAERRPDLIGAVAAISPAVWTTYAQSQSVNRAAFASAADFADCDVITHADRLAETAVRIASGNSDPFHPGVLALAARLPPSASVQLSPGCHDGAFFTAQQLPSLQFLGARLRA